MAENGAREAKTRSRKGCLTCTSRLPILIASRQQLTVSLSVDPTDLCTFSELVLDPAGPATRPLPAQEVRRDAPP